MTEPENEKVATKEDLWAVVTDLDASRGQGCCRRALGEEKEGKGWTKDSEGRGWWNNLKKENGDTFSFEVIGKEIRKNTVKLGADMEVKRLPPKCGNGERAVGGLGPLHLHNPQPPFA